MKFKPFIFALLTLLITSCTREILPEPVEQGEKLVTISAKISPETRVSYTDGAPGTLAWETGDRLILAGYDATGNYISSSTFNWQSGNTFLGNSVPGAETYKAYYNPAGAITLDNNGKVQLPADFWQQTQNGNNDTEHIGNKLLLSDTLANAIDQTFNLTLQSSIIKYDLSQIPSLGAQINKLIWTVEATTGGETRSAILDLNVLTYGSSPVSLTAYLAFDPTVMKIAAGGKVKVTVIGAGRSYEWSKPVAAGKNYDAGKRYTGTINSDWIPAKSGFRFTITTDKALTYEIWQPITGATSPANLTIDWGDGSPNWTINSGDPLPNVALASHPYTGAGNYTITIYSDQPDPSNIQMPLITFYNYPVTDTLLTAVLDPFPNMGATDFTQCFSGCSQLNSIPVDLFRYNKQAAFFEDCFSYCVGLTSIPAGLFSHNTEATDFYGCFSGCTGLTAIPTGLFDNNTHAIHFVDCFSNCPLLTSIPSGLFDNNTEATDFCQCFFECTGLTEIPAGLFSSNINATNFKRCFSGCTKLKLIPEIFPQPDAINRPVYFNDRTMDFTDFCKNVGTHPTATVGTAPELWLFSYGAGVTSTGCFTGANVTNYGTIDPNWK